MRVRARQALRLVRPVRMLALREMVRPGRMLVRPLGARLMRMLVRPGLLLALVRMLLLARPGPRRVQRALVRMLVLVRQRARACRSMRRALRHLWTRSARPWPTWGML